jgi:hypothetical protein
MASQRLGVEGRHDVLVDIDAVSAAHGLSYGQVPRW